MLRENKELFLPMPALPPPGVIRGSSICELLIQRFVAAVRAGTDAPTVVPSLDEGIDPSSLVHLEPSLEEDPTVRWWNRVCFSCGYQGHGVSRCSRIDTLFPFLLAGWSIGVRNGRYRAARTSMDGRSYTPGKGGWSGREGQPLGSSEIVVRLTLGGGGGVGGCGLGGGGEHPPAWQQPLGDARGYPWTPDVQAFPALGSHPPTKAGRCGRPVSDNEMDMAVDGIARLPISTSEMGCPARKMRPVVVDGTTPPQPKVDLSGVRESAVGRPLSVGAPDFSPKMDPRMRKTSASVTRSNAAGTVRRLILPDYLFRWCPGVSSRLLLRCIPRRGIWWTILWLFMPMNSRVAGGGEIQGGLLGS